MPSPIGHTLAGLAAGWLSEPAPPQSNRTGLRSILTPFALWCAFVAAIPDADLLIPHFHRSASHSLTVTALILIIAVVVTGKVTRRRAWVFAAALAGAHASHLLLDWLGTDRFPPPGIQVFWPFSDRFYISGLDIFPPVERRLLRPEAIGINARAALWELLIMGPIAGIAWLVRNRRRKIGVAMARSGAGPR
jgi:inner membrane protein